MYLQWNQDTCYICGAEVTDGWDCFAGTSFRKQYKTEKEAFYDICETCEAVVKVGLEQYDYLKNLNRKETK